MPAKRITPYVLIPLTRGMFAKVDPEDAARVCAHSWIATWSGYAWYATTGDPLGQSSISMHRFVMNAPKGSLVDHRDPAETLDNRKSNLRFATPTESNGNTRIRKTNTSGYKGVKLRCDGKRWVARIQFKKRGIHLGSFDTPEQAARAYDAKAVELYGEFARLNFPDDHLSTATAA